LLTVQYIRKSPDVPEDEETNAAQEIKTVAALKGPNTTEEILEVEAGCPLAPDQLPAIDCRAYPAVVTSIIVESVVASFGGEVSKQR
jgi:hypothetical protein